MRDAAAMAPAAPNVGGEAQPAVFCGTSSLQGTACCFVPESREEAGFSVRRFGVLHVENEYRRSGQGQ